MLLPLVNFAQCLVFFNHASILTCVSDTFDFPANLRLIQLLQIALK